MPRVQYLRTLDQVEQLPDAERTALAEVDRRFRFRANDYYLSLIDWDNPDDPIRKIIIPRVPELDEFGAADASDEESNYVAPGCQHKYAGTVLLLVNEVCGGYCRFCFRKRLFMDENDEVVNNISEGLDYIRKSPQIHNVLLTGGDPLLMSTKKLEAVIRPLREINHVRIIRIGTKMPAFNPYRIIDDHELANMFTRYSTRNGRIYIMTHFNHPKELTHDACLALDLLIKAGVILCNQTPILRGINDDPQVLETLMRRLTDIGVSPYYFFQCRPTIGNMPFMLSLTESFQAFEAGKRGVSGLGRRARLVMSHSLGKIEIIGLTDSHMFLKFHRARNPEDQGRLMIYHRDDNAYWLDDLIPVEETPHPVAKYGHHRAHVMGPE